MEGSPWQGNNGASLGKESWASLGDHGHREECDTRLGRETLGLILTKQELPG